jgi:glycosyltransferase involved in cell wall biosynthesis
MKIAIDIRPLRDTMTGIGRYLHKTLWALSECDHDNEYVLIWSILKKDPPANLPKSPNFKQAYFHFPGKGITALWAYTSFPPAEFFTGNIDVFYAPGFQVPPTRKAARIFTIYDLIPFTHPEWAIPSSVRHVRPRLKHYVERADLIVTISNASARDIINYLNVPEEKIAVSYPGTTCFPRASAEEIVSTRKKFGLEKEFILFVSRLDPRKNLARLFLAFELSKLANDFDLVIVGPKGWHMEEMLHTWQSLPCKNQVRWLDYVKDNELSALYGGAAFMVFPSLLEGFGLPILEAMSAGCPVLTSNISSMPEAGGAAALYVDPYDINSIANGLVKLAGDSELRCKLSQMGYDRAASFTWENTARTMIEAFGKAYEVSRLKKAKR